MQRQKSERGYFPGKTVFQPRKPQEFRMSCPQPVYFGQQWLDIFSNTAMRMQIEGAQRYRDAVLAENRWLAWCSGNHDFYVGDDTPLDAASPAWMREGDATKFVRDGETCRIGDDDDSAIVTTLPWPATDEISVGDTNISYLEHCKSLLHEGRRLREELSVPWILLHHEPPINTTVSAGYDMAESAFSRRILEAAGPDLSIHGHIHEASTREGGSWFDRVGRTVWFFWAFSGQFLQC